MSYFKYKHDLSNLPPKICCDVGKEWKTLEHFSKTKLQTFSIGMRRAPKKVTASTPGIACRVHSGEPETMLKCNGPCGKIHGLDHFSRNTRVRGVYWCYACTDWQLKNEPGYMPYPIPYAPRLDDYKNGREFAEGEVVDDIETVTGDDTASVAPWLAPSFAASFAPSGTVNSEDTQSGSVSTDFGGPTGSSAVPTADGSVYSDDMYSGNAAQNGAPQQFNAWAPDGVYHRVTKAPTVVTDVSTVTSSGKTSEVGSNGWVKPPRRKTPADAPDYIKFGHCYPTLNDDYHSDDGLSDDEI